MTATPVQPPRPNTEAEAAISAGVALAKPQPLDTEGRFYFVSVPQGTVIDLEAEKDKHRDHPKRKRGQYPVHDADSFLRYVEKHGLGPEYTEVWADITSRQVVAVIDAHSSHPAGAGWGEHRVVLRLQHTPSWKAWTDYNGKQFTQVRFAEHIEAHRPDVIDPDAATLAEIARTFKATKSLFFDESHHLSTGQVQLRYHEEIEAKGGKKGDVEIPEEFTLVVAPFEGSPQYGMKARLRFDISAGQLALSYVLDRPDEILRTAFADIVTTIQEGVDAPVFFGLSA